MSTPDEARRDLAGERIPGLFRLWELALVLKPGLGYRVEGAGSTDDGAPLVAVWRDPEAFAELDHDGGRA